MNEVSIAAVTPTICRLMGIPLPEASSPPAFESLIEQAQLAGSGPVEKVLLYAPDAIGSRLIAAHRPDFKPVLQVTTLFDRLIDAGRKVAIVAVRGSSIATIFKERSLAYFSEDYDADVTARTLQLIEADKHDFILAYHQEYDDSLHATTPESERSLAAMRRHIESFITLARAFNRSSASRKRLLGFVPDHGAHVDPETGKGTHGLDIPEDMDLTHFYGIPLAH